MNGAISGGYSLDGLDSISASLDDLPASLDSPLWQGGQILLGAYNTSHKLGYFTGTAMDAIVETGEAQLFKGQRAHVSAITPFVDGGSSITVQVGSRNLQTETVSWGTATSLNAIGKAPVRSNARFHRARVNISGGFTRAQGIEPEAVPMGVQ